jgi:AcrR family transcriptional regulator
MSYDARVTTTSRSPDRPRRYTSTRRAKQAEQTRSDVLLAAARLFAQKGWSGTTLTAIAAEADVAVETIYAGFKSKKALLQAAIDIAIAGDAQPIPLAERDDMRGLLSGPTQQRLQALFGLVGRIYSGPVIGVWSAMLEAATSDPQIATWAAEHERRRRQTVAATLEMVFGHTVEAAAIDAVWAVTSMEIYRKLTVEQGWSNSQWQAWLVEAVPHLIAAGPSR